VLSLCAVNEIVIEMVKYLFASVIGLRYNKNILHPRTITSKKIFAVL